MIELETSVFIFLFLTIFIAGLLIGLYLLWKIRAWLTKKRLQNQYALAKSGETEAEKLLIDHGFSIVEKQARFPLTLLYDGAPWQTDIIADLIVAKAGATYVAEVKTGINAPQIKTAATRRQLLEYYVTYKPEGILLVDMHKKIIHTVEFII